MIREQLRSTLSGWLVLPLIAAAMAVDLWLLITAEPHGAALAALVGGAVVLAILSGGVFVVYPNEARVLTLFGKYSGSVKRDGFHWANPFLAKKRLSLRIRN
jgi:regulator of protease activity HflC (stomatin/prohibitin superfamily)